jgi:hypothetical protein
VVIRINPSGLAAARSAGTTAITASYVRPDQTIVTTQSPVTVHAQDTTHFGALQISLPGDVRRITVGTALQFQVIVRDGNGIQVTSPAARAGLVVTSSAPGALAITETAGSFFYSMTAITLPSSSAVPGIPNMVTVMANIAGAMITIPIMIVP